MRHSAHILLNLHCELSYFYSGSYIISSNKITSLILLPSNILLTLKRYVPYTFRKKKVERNNIFWEILISYIHIKICTSSTYVLFYLTVKFSSSFTFICFWFLKPVTCPFSWSLDTVSYKGAFDGLTISCLNFQLK